MMKTLVAVGLIALLGSTSRVHGQTGLGGSAPSVSGAVPSATAPAPANLWSFLLPTADQKAACKTCFCNSPLGQLTSSAAAPLSAMSGGLLPNRCLQNSIANDIANKPADSSEGAAARVKRDEEDAKARRSAVRYLGTVDCNYWPEAVEALRLSLRKDRNECVRFEAALALRNGCCCKNDIIKALEICITGSTVDGFPAERSDRVRAAAADALARCPLMPTVIEPKAPEIEIKKVEASPNVDPSEYYRRVAQMPREQVLASARATLVSLQNGRDPGSGAAIIAVAPIHPRPSGLADIVADAFAPDTSHGASQSRQPFFSNVTKALTGKQDPASSARSDTPIGASAVPTVMTAAPTANSPAANDPRVKIGGLRDAREDVARMIADGGYSPAEISAAQVRLDEMQGQARRAAVRYLATVDCQYYHEAEAGLVAALRADRVENVRLEAARALGDCRGVTVRILDALNLTALGLDLDGNPAETSDAVRLAAGHSLNRCLMRGIGPPPVVKQEPFSIREASIVPTVTPEERRRAETVSTNSNLGPAVIPCRTLSQMLANFLGRDPAPGGMSSDNYIRQATTARMRGLTPIGPDASLAMPAQPANGLPTP